ncbi:hypothetical protein C0J52_17958 [Blattella germanica]|nr:hypothetical protein C0J52_17958 [Blattella germanica]
MEHFQPALDPRKQELLEARFLGTRGSGDFSTATSPSCPQCPTRCGLPTTPGVDWPSVGGGSGSGGRERLLNTQQMALVPPVLLLSTVPASAELLTAMSTKVD